MSTLRTKILTIGTAAAVGLTAWLPTAGAVADEGGSGKTTETRQELAAVRAVTAKYHRVQAALADGFVATDHCVELPAEAGPGGMGYHFVNPTRIGEHLDIREPEVLLYEQDGNGGLRLTGVEYLYPSVDEDGEAISDPNVELFDHELTLGPAGYALHVWLWKHNPTGMFSDWNPDVSC